MRRVHTLRFIRRLRQMDAGLATRYSNEYVRYRNLVNHWRIGDCTISATGSTVYYIVTFMANSFETTDLTWTLKPSAGLDSSHDVRVSA
jgi:glutamyl-tRNA reductase